MYSNIYPANRLKNKDENIGLSQITAFENGFSILTSFFFGGGWDFPTKEYFHFLKLASILRLFNIKYYLWKTVTSRKAEGTFLKIYETKTDLAKRLKI